MQLNGTTGPIMAATEPPEPPPRNPDKINASLKQVGDSKTTKSLDTSDRSINNNKLFKPILSLDNTTTTVIPSSTILSSSNNDRTTMDNGLKSITNIINNISSTIAAAAQTTVNSHESSATMKIITGLVNGSDDGIEGRTIIRPNDNAEDNNDSERNGHDTRNGEAKMSGNTIDVKQNYQQGNFIEKGNTNESPLMGDKIQQIHAMKTDTVGDSFDDESPQTMKLRQDNERLASEIFRLKKLLENSPDGAIGGIDLSDNNSFDAQSTDGSTSKIERLENELKQAKEQIMQLKNERKKLKIEKADLLSHVKQLCLSLQDKEQELRDFIRNFEHRIRETESSNAKMSSDRERERWSLLKHARDESERSLALAAQLNARDIQLQRTQEQLQEARRQLSGCMSDQESLLSFAPLTPPSGMINHLTGPPGGFIGITDRGSCSADSGVRGSSDRESAAGDLNLSDGTCDNGPCITVDPDSISLVSSHHMYQFGTPKERSPTLSPLNSGAFSRSIDSGALSRSVEQLGSPVDSEGPPITRRTQSKPNNTGTLGIRTGRGGTWGSISRVFARTRHRNKNIISDTESSADFQWSTLTEEGYAEKLRQLREASSIPIERWRASQVLAWLEVALGMPQYSGRCSENVKSGKVLLELNDGELETGLGLTHPMHRKKLRLAIEEQRRPELIRYPTIGQLGHTWVASEWLQDIGLPQYAESFLHSLVDARMLDTLSKKELEKFLNVTRKFHQASIVHGIHVLRILKYDRQSLTMRRMQCENVDGDPIVWTNHRFIRWARSIDLGEYAENLKDSGVHGGLVVLEPSFTGETMATALGIPPSKNIIRRHLSTEFDALVLPARATLGQGIRTGGAVVPITGPNGLQYNTADRRSNGSLRFAAWRGSQGSLTKAFRFNKPSRSDKMGRSSTSPTPSYSSSENGIYATIGNGFGTVGTSHIFSAPPPPTTAPPPPPSHRVSAPPHESHPTYATYAEHRRVKSISDIEVMAATPV